MSQISSHRHGYFFLRIKYTICIFINEIQLFTKSTLSTNIYNVVEKHVQSRSMIWKKKNKIITRCLSPNKDDSTGADSESSNAY